MNSILIRQLEAMIDPAQEKESCLCNMLAVVYQSDLNISWAGIYRARLQDGSFTLGPFQGKPACMRIGRSKGVIGAAADQSMPLRVDNVLEFDGHIACDSASRSELVIPLFKNGQTAAVLDLDSEQFSNFSCCSDSEIRQIQKLFEAVI